MKVYVKVVCVALLLGSSLGFSIDIFQALEKGDKKVINLWSKNFSHTNVVNEQDQTVLMQAVIKRNKLFVKSLLKRGVEVNARDKYGKTALDYAVESNNKSLVVLLVKKQAKVTTLENQNIVKQFMITKNPFKIILSCIMGVVGVVFMIIVGGFGVLVTVIPYADGSHYPWSVWIALFGIGGGSATIAGACKLDKNNYCLLDKELYLS